MSWGDFGDNWLKNSLPTFHGGKDKNIARTSLDKLGGPDGFKTAITIQPDGTKVVVQTKGMMPPQVFTYPPMKVATNKQHTHFLYGHVLGQGAYGNNTADVVTSPEQIVTESANALPLGQHDNILQMWNYDPDTKAHNTSYAPFYAPADSTIARYATYTYYGCRLPAKVINGKVYFGWLTHGKVTDAEFGDLTLFRPKASGINLDNGNIADYALIPGSWSANWSSSYLYFPGVQLAIGGIYIAADGTRFIVDLWSEVTYTGVAWSEVGGGTIHVEAYRDTPTFDGKGKKIETIAVLQTESPPRRRMVFNTDTGEYEEAYRTVFAKRCMPSPDGKKYCVTMAFNSAHIDSVWEVVLSGGSATELPTASISCAADFVPSDYRSAQVTDTYIISYDSSTEVTRTALPTMDIDDYVTTYSASRTEVTKVNALERVYDNRVIGAGYDANGDLKIYRAVREITWDRSPEIFPAVSGTRTLQIISPRGGTPYKSADSGPVTFTGQPMRYVEINGSATSYTGVYQVHAFRSTTVSVSFELLINDVQALSYSAEFTKDNGALNVTADIEASPAFAMAASPAASSSGDAAAVFNYLTTDLSGYLSAPVAVERMDAFEFTTDDKHVVFDHHYAVDVKLPGQVVKCVTIDGAVHEVSGTGWRAFNPITNEFSNTQGESWR